MHIMAGTFLQHAMKKKPTVIILTGCSGSGKSTALDSFEDAGFYCVDNMPARVVPGFLKEMKTTAENVAGWVFCMDLRDSAFLAFIDIALEEIKKHGFHSQIVFLDADEPTLLRRYSQTRRHHPLGRGGSLLEAVQAEKEQMRHLRSKATHIIDTTNYTVHELKFVILNIAQQYTISHGMIVNIVSFGFKYGTPPGADMIIDVRFLTNPYFIPDLKPKDGETAEIQNYVLEDPKTSQFLQKYLDLLDFLIPQYEKEGKAYLTIAIGCTGGRHRSVVIARQVYLHIQKIQPKVRLVHRDIALT